MLNPALLALTLDPRMTPQAVRVALYVASLGEGEHDVKGEDLAILVCGGEKPVRDAIRRAAHCGYLEARFGGRAGHKLVFVEPKNDAPRGGNSEMTPPGEAIQPGNDAPRGGNSPPTTTTPPTTPPTPTAGAGEREQAPEKKHHPPPDIDLKRIRDYLGPHADAVDMMLASADHRPTWIAAVLGKHGPGGTYEHQYTGIPPNRRPAMLASALIDYAGTGKPYDNKHFDGFVRKAANDERRGNGRNDGGGANTGRAPGQAGRKAATGTDGIAGDRGGGWIIEGED